jgi:probable phosphoglycerate mutase
LIHKDFSCEFYFIRHGESESNATPGFAAGKNFNAPLTEKGHLQALRLGERLKSEGITFGRVYSSSLIRTVQTTENMLKGMGEAGRDFPKVDAIIEQQMPGWRGVPVSEVYTPENTAYIRTKGANFVPPEGESLRTVQRRMSNWIEDEFIYNQELTSEPIDLRVAVVGHGTASRCLFQYIMRFDDSMLSRIAIENTSIARFLFDKQGWAMLKLNDSSHLDDNGVPNFEAAP